MIRSAVIVRSVVPSARSCNDFFFIGLIIFYKIKNFCLNTVIFYVKKSAIFSAFTFTVMFRIVGKAPPQHCLMTFRTYPCRKRLSFCYTAAFVIQSAGVDVKSFVERFAADNEIHAPTDIFHIKVILAGRIEFTVIKFQNLFAGKGDFPLIQWINPTQFQGVFINTLIVRAFFDFKLFSGKVL